MPERSSERQLAFSLRRLGIVPVIAIAAGFACGDRSPTLPAAPSPMAPTPAPVPPAAKRIVGRVLDTSDTPVPGASLTFNTFRGPMTVMSDAAGSFDVTVDTWISGLDVVMEKPGYERSGRWISVGAAGEVVHESSAASHCTGYRGRFAAAVDSPGRSDLRLRFRISVSNRANHVGNRRTVDGRSRPRSRWGAARARAEQRIFSEVDDIAAVDGGNCFFRNFGQRARVVAVRRATVHVDHIAESIGLRRFL